MWKFIYLTKYWTFHIKSLWILLHLYWKQISFETNITSLWKIDFLILLLLHFIFTILLLIWKNRKLRLGVDRWRLIDHNMSGSTRSLRDQWAAGPAAASWSCSTKSRNPDPGWDPQALHSPPGELDPLAPSSHHHQKLTVTTQALSR